MDGHMFDGLFVLVWVGLAAIAVVAVGVVASLAYLAYRLVT